MFNLPLDIIVRK